MLYNGLNIVKEENFLEREPHKMKLSMAKESTRAVGMASQNCTPMAGNHMGMAFLETWPMAGKSASNNRSKELNRFSRGYPQLFNDLELAQPYDGFGKGATYGNK